MKKCRALLLSHHTDVGGMADQLYLYLSKHFDGVIHISHPLLPNTTTKSYLKVGKQYRLFKIFPPLQFVLESVYNYIYFKKLKLDKYQYSLVLCIDPLSYLHARLLKLFFRIHTLIYYNVDYSPRRYVNWFLNFTYQQINRFALHDCDYFFYITGRFLVDLDPNKRYRHKSFWIKHIHNASKPKFNTKQKNLLVVCGHLSVNLDFQPLLEALALLDKEGITFRFGIFGNGNKLIELNNQVKKLKLEEKVLFKGSVDHDKLVQKILPQYSVGLAPYIKMSKLPRGAAQHAFMGDDLSTKVIEYIGCGLPVISTKPYPAFEAIEKHHFGYLVKDAKDWYKSLLNLLRNDNKRKQFSRAAYQYAKRYHEEKVLTPVIKIITNHI